MGTVQHSYQYKANRTNNIESYDASTYTQQHRPSHAHTLTNTHTELGTHINTQWKTLSTEQQTINGLHKSQFVFLTLASLTRQCVWVFGATLNITIDHSYKA